MNLLKLSNDNFTDEVLNSDIPVLVDFYADWCGPCKVLSPVIDELAEEYEDKIKIVKLNIDEANEIAVKYSVMSIPTLILFKDGEAATRLVGARSKKEIIVEELGL